MYPNPQDVLPLPERPNVEWYRRVARDLRDACRSGSPDAVNVWAARLAGVDVPGPGTPLARFASDRLARDRGRGPCALADAQFVVARAFGFATWRAFITHLDALAGHTAVTHFERAVNFVIHGDAEGLRRTLARHPELVRARSARDHRATLLHYVAANGVENYRQVTPPNIVEIAAILLDAGAEVDAEADVYGGGATTLGLTATSVHPAEAGVQLALIDLLLARGARLDRDGTAGNAHNIVFGCLANGQPEAARHLASRGASLDLRGAAGIGRLDVVRELMDRETPDVRGPLVSEAFGYACGYGQAEVVRFLLARGVEADRSLRMYGDGHTGLHIAAYHAHLEVVRALLAAGARTDVRDDTWHTTPRTWAQQGRADGAADATRYDHVLPLLD